MCLSPRLNANPRTSVALATLLGMLLLAAAAPAQTTQSVQLEPTPAAGAVATQTAPATSPEAVLFSQIGAMRQMPTPGPGQPSREAYVQAVTEHLGQSLALTNEYIEKYPKGEHIEQVLLQRIETMYLLASLQNQPLDKVQAEVRETLKREDLSQETKAAARYILALGSVQEIQKELMADQVLTEQQKEQRYREQIVRIARDYVQDFPKSDRAVEFYAVLIRNELVDNDYAAANRVLEQMRENLPDNEAIPQLAGMIEAARTSATRPAATQPGATTRPAPGQDVPEID